MRWTSWQVRLSLVELLSLVRSVGFLVGFLVGLLVGLLVDWLVAREKVSIQNLIYSILSLTPYNMLHNTFDKLSRKGQNSRKFVRLRYVSNSYLTQSFAGILFH